MAFSIRNSKLEDLRDIDALYARSYPKLLKEDYSPSVLVTIVPMFSKAQPKLVTSDSFYVATEEGEILGAGGWTKTGPRGEVIPRTGHIRHFATDPSALRRGIAKALMERCLSGATRVGVDTLCCYSTLTAVPFYQAMGFEVKGDLIIEFASALEFPAVWMENKLV